MASKDKKPSTLEEQFELLGDLAPSESKLIYDTIKEASDNSEKDKLSPSELRYLYKLLQEAEQRKKTGGTAKWFIPGTEYGIENCPKHAAFFAAGATYDQRAFIAANRVGKTLSGAYELACHLTGDYPSWWKGRVFKEPTNCWACGKTGQTTRDTVQLELVGQVGALGTGMIPKDKILQTWSRPGIPNALDTVQVKHVTGGVSTLGFKSFDQDVQAFMGTARHAIWCDEECPHLIYNECLIRTATTKGIIFITFTPLTGMTPLIMSFADSADFVGGSQRFLAINEAKMQEELENANQ